MLSFFESRGRDQRNERQAKAARDRVAYAVSQFKAGKTPKEIALYLGISEKTVRGYLTKNGFKLGRRGRAPSVVKREKREAERWRLLRNWKRPQGVDNAISEVVHLTRRVTDHVCNSPANPDSAPYGFVPRRHDQPRVKSFRDLLRRFTADSQEVVG